MHKSGIPSSKNPTASRSPAEIANQLGNGGYFKYADVLDLEQLKLEIGKGLADDHYLPFVDGDRPSYKPKDPRHYILDGETLFEQNGIIESLQEMTPLFQKMSILMEVSDHLEEYDTANQWLNHEISINRKRYIIFHKFKGYGWGEAAQRFADMINDQLDLQRSGERIYLIAVGNDGRAVFLTDEQCSLISALIDNSMEKPLAVVDWCHIMQVKRAEIC